MKIISIKELHDKTGHWLRRVKSEGEVIVTERGNPIARVLPPTRRAKRNPLAKRRLLRGMRSLMNRRIGGPDSAVIVSDMRDGR
jgi:prevent-host-death family protein